MPCVPPALPHTGVYSDSGCLELSRAVEIRPCHQNIAQCPRGCSEQRGARRGPGRARGGSRQRSSPPPRSRAAPGAHREAHATRAARCFTMGDAAAYTPSFIILNLAFVFAKLGLGSCELNTIYNFLHRARLFVPTVFFIFGTTPIHQ